MVRWSGVIAGNLRARRGPDGENVDTGTGNEILSLFADAHERGNTILLVTHERRIAEHADCIVHVRDGVRERTEPLGGGD